MSNVVKTLKRSKEAIGVMMSDSYLRELLHLIVIFRIFFSYINMEG